MHKTLYKALIPPLIFLICLNCAEAVKAAAPPKEIRVFVSLDKSAKSLGITSQQISGKASIYLLQKGIKTVFISEKESKRIDHLRIDISARQKLVWITVSYIKVFKFKFRGDYSYTEGVLWSADRSSVAYNDSKSYLEFIGVLLENFLTEHYYSIRS